FGILIAYGLSPRPERRDYWSTEECLVNPLISKCMKRDRFEQFVRNCHWVDKSTCLRNVQDSYWKVRPLINMQLSNFRKYYFPVSLDFLYDESMIKYFGRHSCKLFIPVKPIRAGFKVLSKNDPRGLCTDLSFYQGSDPFISKTY